MKFVNVVSNSSGSVGIGTSDPPARLYVTGSYDASQTNVILRGGFPNPLGGAGILDVQNSAGTSLFFVSGSGFIGINTTTPFYQLDVVGQGRFSQALFAGSTGAITYNGGVTNTYNVIGLSGKSLSLGSNLVYDRFFMDTSGNVGIGTTLMDSKLVVNGNSVLSGSLNPAADNNSNYVIGTSTKRWSNIVSTSLSGSLTNLSDGTSYLIAGSGISIVTGSNGSVTINGQVGDITSVTAGNGLLGGGTSGDVTLTINDSVVATISGSTFTGPVKFNSGLSGSLTQLTNGTSYLVAGNNVTITSASNGQVTINSSAPAGTISGTGTTNYVSKFTGTSTLGNSNIFDNGTSVGIGTTTPPAAALLTVSGTIVTKYNTGLESYIAAGTYSAGTTGFYPVYAIGGTFGSNDTVVKYGAGNNNFVLFHGSNVVMSANVNENVSIGAASYAGRFFVSGSSTASTPTMVVREGTASTSAGLFDAQNYLGTSILFVSGSGRVGVGTNVLSTSNKFEVYQGRIAASGYSSELYVEGSNSGYSMLTAFGSGNYTDLWLRTVSATTDGVWIKATTGRVGIGSSSPGYPLDVNGTISSTALRVGTSSGNALANSFNGAVGAGFRVIDSTNPKLELWHDGNSVGQFNFSANTLVYGVHNGNGSVAEYFRVLSGGTFVASGSVIPGTDVTYDLGSTSKRWNNIYAANISGSITGSNLTAGQIVVAGSGGVLSGSNKLYWYNANNWVGIGTNSPASQVDLYGTSGGRVQLGFDSPAYGVTIQAAATPWARYYSFQNSSNTILGSFGGYGGANSLTYLFIGAAYDNTALRADQSAGNVTIGNTSGTSRLYVTGSSIATTPTMTVKEGVATPQGGAGTFDVQNSAGTSLFFVSGSGNVGIGTTVSQVPSHRLHVAGKIGGGLFIDSSLEFLSNGNTELKANTDLKLGYALSTVIKSTGNVGIGTLTPSSRLHVYGSSTSTTPTAIIQEGATPTGGAGAFDVQNVGGTSMFFVTGSGRVGINTNLPVYTLDLIGSARITSTVVHAGGDVSLNQSATGNTYFYTPAFFAKQGGVGVGGANYERLYVSYGIISNDAAGTGVFPNFQIINGGNVRFNIPSSLTNALGVTGSLEPDADNTRDLGSSTKRWRNLYAANINGSLTGSNLTAGQVVVAGTGGLLSGSNNFWWENSTGNIGIGTSTLNSKLEIVGISTNISAPDNAMLTVRDSSNNGMTFGYDSTANRSFIYSRTVGAGSRQIGLNGTMYVGGFNSGVGIGVTNPSGVLHVSGSSTGTTPTLFVKHGIPDGSDLPVLYVVNSAGGTLLHVSASGIVGVSATPSAWSPGARALEFSYPTFGMNAAGAAFMSFNARNSVASTWVYKSNDEASLFTGETDGSFTWKSAAIGTAGNNVTFTNTLSLSAVGNLTPGADNTQDLGAAGTRWRNLYATSISGSLTGSNVLANQVVVAGTGGVLSGSYNLFWDNSNQKLGVGTSSVAASAIMQVNRQTGNLPQIALTNSGVAGTVHWIGTGWLNDGITGVTSDTLSIGNNLQKSVSIVSNNSSVLTVVDDGTKKKAVLPQSNSYIGIGTTNPTSILHVVGHTSAGTPTALIKEGIAAQSTGIAVLDVQNSAGTSLLFVSGSGNVGVGTNNPTEILMTPTNKNMTIGGYSFFGSTYSQAGTILGYNAKADTTNNVSDQVLVATTNVNVGYGFIRMSNASGGIQFHTIAGSVTAGSIASSERVRFTDTGLVGIGTTSPTTKLAVYSGAVSANYGVFSGSLAAYASTTGALYTYWNTTSNYGTIVSVADNAGTAAPLQLRVGGTLSTHIDSSGNVGIGTATVSGKFHVYNASTATQYIGTVNHTLRLSADDSLGGVEISNAASTPIIFKMGAPGNEIGRFLPNGTWAATGSFEPGTDNTYSLGSTTKRWKNLYATSISGSLTGSNVSAGQVVVGGTGGVLSGSNNFWWDNSGQRVGIGTSSLTNAFTVYSGADGVETAAIDVTGATGSIGVGKYIRFVGGPGIGWVNNYSGGAGLWMGANTSTKTFYVGTTGTYAGNVGINTTLPGFKLEVNGDFAATTKSFVIPHPLKQGWKLRYGSLESPYHGVRLTGEAEVVDGKCEVTLPDYIGTLCKQEGAQVQITSFGHSKHLWVDNLDVTGNKFTVKTRYWFFMKLFGKKKYKFFWSFTAIRKDIGDMQVEFNPCEN